MSRAPMPARFRGGPWNAVTKQVDRLTPVIRVEESPKIDIGAILRGAEIPPARVGVYVQTNQPDRYEWDGWR